MSDHSSCSCWRCWLQSTTFILLLIVILGLMGTLTLMHEEKIDDKYVSWLEKITEVAITSLAVALKSSGPTAHEPKAPTEKEK